MSHFWGSLQLAEYLHLPPATLRHWPEQLIVTGAVTTYGLTTTAARGFLGLSRAICPYLFFGRLRPYKGIEKLIAATVGSSMPGPKCSSPARKLLTAVGQRHKIHLASLTLPLAGLTERRSVYPGWDAEVQNRDSSPDVRGRPRSHGGRYGVRP